MAPGGVLTGWKGQVLQIVHLPFHFVDTCEITVYKSIIIEN